MSWHIPDELARLDAELVTHSADHGDLSQFKGRRVAVVGGGQSALESAALPHEGGADVAHSWVTSAADQGHFVTVW